MPKPLTPPYRELAEFRYQLRRFLRFSELAAMAAGLKPQQHQLLLAVRGLPPGVPPTVGRLAERLQLRHHSVVGLVDRLEQRGLLMRVPDEHDRRQIRLRMTRRGASLLERLAQHHRDALAAVGPRLGRALQAVLQTLPRRREAGLEPQGRRRR